MSSIKLIRNKDDHQQALDRLVKLMDSDPPQGSADAEELDVLGVLLEYYEEQNFKIDPPDPISAIKFRMDQEGLKNKDLALYIGSASKVSEVLSGRRKLSLNMIRRINEGLGIPAEILIREPNQQAALNGQFTGIEWYKFPLPEMLKRGYFTSFKGTIAELKEYAEEHVSTFLSSIPGGHSLQPTLLRSNAHLRDGDKTTAPYALWAWQVRVLQKAAKYSMTATYEKGTVTEDWMRQLAQLSWSEKGPLLAKEYLEKHGIYLIIEPHLPKTYMDGAVCICPTGRPIVALTLRYDRLDNFWFSLMHELAHIALHLDDDQSWFIDNLQAISDEHIEQEADALAESALIPMKSNEIRDHCSSTSDITALATKLRISPTIIAGRIRHEQKDHQLFGTAFREKVRHFFPQTIEGAQN